MTEQRTFPTAMPANSPLFFGGDAGEKARTGVGSRERRAAILKSASWEAAFARAMGGKQTPTNGNPGRSQEGPAFACSIAQGKGAAPAWHSDSALGDPMAWLEDLLRGLRGLMGFLRCGITALSLQTDIDGRL